MSQYVLESTSSSQGPWPRARPRVSALYPRTISCRSARDGCSWWASHAATPGSREQVAALVYSLVSRRFVRMKSRGIHQRHMNGGEGNECGNHRRQSASRRRRPSGRRAFTPSSERSLREMISRCVRSRVMYVAARVTIRRARRDRRAPLPPWIISVPWRTCALSPSRSCAAAARQSQPRCERPPARADDSRWSGVARSSRDER